MHVTGFHVREMVLKYMKTVKDLFESSLDWNKVSFKSIETKL